MRFSKTTVLVLIWVLFTCSLAGWWMYFALNSSEITSQTQRMFYWEGLSLLLLILSGGVALSYYQHREIKRHDQMKEFFATLTHELKTPLASLRVQAESLQEDLGETTHAALVKRLIQASNRLELQLENALFLASLRRANDFHSQNLSLRQNLQNLKMFWPEVELKPLEDLMITADHRAFEGILKNLLQNARVHGKATEVLISAEREKLGYVTLRVKDNGRGFNGDSKKLGQLFERPTSTSGSGVGLHLSQKLAREMNGSLDFNTSTAGFEAILNLPEAHT